VNVSELCLRGLKLITLDIFRDERGFFTERFNEQEFASHGLPTRFLQDNHSRSAPGALRGLHYQANPAQGKLVGVVRGRIFDVVVDIRPESPTFGAHVVTELDDQNGRLLWIPAGFAHGFSVVGHEPADVLYKVDSRYERATEGGILWSDSELAIKWPSETPIVSAKDRQLPAFATYRQNPVHWES
jgi:dTDP-4-dehydrorhamnose 3,5-epimerase